MNLLEYLVQFFDHEPDTLELDRGVFCLVLTERRSGRKLECTENHVQFIWETEGVNICVDTTLTKSEGDTFVFQPVYMSHLELLSIECEDDAEGSVHVTLNEQYYLLRTKSEFDPEAERRSMLGDTADDDSF